MSSMKVAIGVLAGSLALGSIVASLADDPGSTRVKNIDFDEDVGHRDDLDNELVSEEDDLGDGDGTRGDDGTGGGNNTGDGDGTAGNDGTGGGNNTGDGDGTAGNDGTTGGDNSYVASVDAASVDDSYAGGGSISGASHSGGGSTG